VKRGEWVPLGAQHSKIQTAASPELRAARSPEGYAERQGLKLFRR